MGRKFTSQIQYEILAIERSVRREEMAEGHSNEPGFAPTGSVRVDEEGILFAEFVSPGSWEGLVWIARERQHGFHITKEPSDWK